MPGEVSLEVTRVSPPQSWPLRAWTPKLQAWGCPGERHSGSRPPKGYHLGCRIPIPDGGWALRQAPPKRLFLPYRTSNRIVSGKMWRVARSWPVAGTPLRRRSSHICGLYILSGNIFQILTYFFEST
jgi:hypothetical protein